MWKSDRRTFLAGGAALSMPALSQNSRPADMQDARAPQARKLLQSRWPLADIQKSLVTAEQWQPYPRWTDRSAWSALPAEIREDFVSGGKAALDSTWSVLPATLLLEYVRNGNRSNYEREMRKRRVRLESLVWAELVEGNGRFLDEIANGIWLTCEETFWGYPAHLSLQSGGSGLPNVAEPVIDLFAAEAASLLAWTHYLLGPQLDKVHKRVDERLRHEIDRRILTPYEKRSDFWWMGLEANRPMNNWNPWINSNCLTCALLMEGDASRRAALVHKIVRSLDRFLDSYHDDGGCDEGPSYWGHAGGSLFDNLELLHSASNGRLQAWDMPLVREIGRYITRVHINNDWYVNFADASARVSIYGDLVYRYGKRIDDADMQALGAWKAKQTRRSGGSMLRELPAVFGRAEIAKAPARQPFSRDAWLSGVQVMTARRKQESVEGFYLAAQGGHNAESHNHNDVGNFVVFLDGSPLIIDVGVETYTAKTFSSRRYEIWTMQSAYHNLPTINGAMQSAGRTFAAREVRHRSDDNAAEFSLNLAAAYPKEARVQSWQRTLRLDRTADQVLVRDQWKLDGEGELQWTLMTPCQVTREGNELLLSGEARARVKLPAGVQVQVEDVDTSDARLVANWGPKVRRVLLKASRVPSSGEATVQIVRA